MNDKSYGHFITASASFILLLISVFAGIFFSCGGKAPAAGSPEEVIELMKENYGKEPVLGLYSSETIKFMEKYMDASGMDKQSAINTLSFIPDSAEYAIESLKVAGDTCIMKLRFLEEGPEKSRGLVIDLTMVKEDGSWRIDRSADFKRLLQSQINKGVDNYLDRIR